MRVLASTNSVRAQRREAAQQGLDRGFYVIDDSFVAESSEPLSGPWTTDQRAHEDAMQWVNCFDHVAYTMEVK